jgi:hypothetical protein
VRRAAEYRFVQGLPDIVVSGSGTAASVRAAVRDHPGFIYVELVRRCHVSVSVDNHSVLLKSILAPCNRGLYRLPE